MNNEIKQQKTQDVASRVFLCRPLKHIRGKPYMDFNLNLKVDKAMDKLSESKILRYWTYVISIFTILGILSWQAASILTGVAKIIEALK
ncbi:hypothetical protein [Acinetobacter bereziniae]|uniref:hypothetical protein n=2 Tax=Acinetobacter TaxID=469 RepID=UPI003570F489